MSFQYCSHCFSVSRSACDGGGDGRRSVKEGGKSRHVFICSYLVCVQVRFRVLEESGDGAKVKA
jgi:hypothetical protein